ncbi:death domain-containing protein 1 [Eucyclogobius newberryi]|uniref:death domain-containing protein 1 n=1 Tax=Eucyclogobius newberryi TaxID=166745 RepID=UPI003B5A6B4F
MEQVEEEEEEQLSDTIMEEDLHYNAFVDVLTERMRGLEAAKVSRDPRRGRVGGCKGARGGGGDAERRDAEMKEVMEEEDAADVSLATMFLSVTEDIRVIIDKLNSITTRLDEQMCLLCSNRGNTRSQQPTDVDPAPQNISQSQTPSPPDDLHLAFSDPAAFNTVDDGNESGQPDLKATTGTDEMLDSGQEEVKGQHAENDCASLETDDEHANKKDGANLDWITVGLTGELDSDHSLVPDACFVRAAAGASRALRCDVAEALSCLMVTGPEELVSRVIQLRVRDGARVSFPVAVVIPFYTRHRGNYRDIAVKVVDVERRASYICPITTEGNYSGHRGSFAEVRVYALGLFAVVSCLKRENYTVPRKGVCLKLSMDPRICLTYLPACFTAPVMAQAMIQPLEAVLLSAVKSRSEDYGAVVSTSPLVYLTHPSCQALRRALTLTLPCAPKPKQKSGTLDEAARGYGQLITATLKWGSACSVRTLPDCAKSSKESHDEFLVLLGYKEQQWSTLEKITVRNQQKGLVSFEVTENYDRLLVVRLLSTLSPCHLVSLVEGLEEAVYCHAVAVVLLRQREDPRAVMVALVLSKDLAWELSKLKARGFSSSTTDSSLEITMCEGDRLLLRFSGNITSEGARNSQNEHTSEWIAFHSQRTNHLTVRLTEVDPFGNHSSSHYKGTAVFHKVNRGQLDRSCDCPGSVNVKLLGDPICKLPLALPKREKDVSRLNVTRLKICEDTSRSLPDCLLLWLSEQLSAEELSLLVPSLRLRRSAAQLVKLRAGDSLSGQALHLLLMWRRTLPASPHQSNVNHLANCLAKSGRPDLARELLLRQTAISKQASGDAGDTGE